MSSPAPPNTEPLTRQDGVPSQPWAKWFDALTRQMKAMQGEGGYGSLLAVAHDGDVPGYVKADGRALNAADYPRLYEAIGLQYGTSTGPSGELQFLVPNLVAEGALRWHIRTDPGR